MIEETGHDPVLTDAGGYTSPPPGSQHYWIVDNGPNTGDLELVARDTAPSKWSSGFISTAEVAEQRLSEEIALRRSFWDRYVTRAGDPEIARVDGRHYVIEPELRYPQDAGHGGRRLYLVFNDGREVETRSPWTQGEIPLDYRDRLPDNARFEVRYDRVGTGAGSDD